MLNPTPSSVVTRESMKNLLQGPCGLGRVLPGPQPGPSPVENTATHWESTHLKPARNTPECSSGTFKLAFRRPNHRRLAHIPPGATPRSRTSWTNHIFPSCDQSINIQRGTMTAMPDGKSGFQKMDLKKVRVGMGRMLCRTNATGDQLSVRYRLENVSLAFENASSTGLKSGSRKRTSATA